MQRTIIFCGIPRSSSSLSAARGDGSRGAEPEPWQIWETPPPPEQPGGRPGAEKAREQELAATKQWAVVRLRNDDFGSFGDFFSEGLVLDRFLSLDTSCLCR